MDSVHPLLAHVSNPDIWAEPLEHENTTRDTCLIQSLNYAARHCTNLGHVNFVA